VSRTTLKIEDISLAKCLSLFWRLRAFDAEADSSMSELVYEPEILYLHPKDMSLVV
jgi:hypothetical protein